MCSVQRRCFQTVVFAAFIFEGAFRAVGQPTMPVDYSVLVTAEVDAAVPRITLKWPPGRFVTSYTVARKDPAANTWAALASLSSEATSFSDSDVRPGVDYDYQITKTTTRGFTGYGYVRAGIRIGAVETRGKILLLVDNTQASALSSELSRLEQDLVGDGWTVLRQDVSPNDSVPAVKAIVQSHYQANPDLRALFLFGHISVPYSGDIMPDGHENHRGAWPADVYYADMSGQWTDHLVNSTGAEREINRNRPGDGKFDQSVPPGRVALEVGRVDFWQMTTYANKIPSRSETDLLRQYLNKNHDFRHARLSVPRRALIADFFPDKGDDPVGNSGWRNFAPLVAPENIRELGYEEYFPVTSQEAYLLSYAAGGGSSYTLSAGIGSSDDFSTKNVRVVFALFLGSFYGDWNNESNFLRASLGSGHVLSAVYAGFPHWLLQPMALGETIGFSARFTQNNRAEGVFPPYNEGAGEVHISLLGDPSLRMHPVLPPSDLSAQSGNGVRLVWNPSPDNNVLGYHVYRSPVGQRNFTRVNSDPVGAAEYFDSAPTGEYEYMVRTLKLEVSPSGSYLNLSQGVFVRAQSSASTPVPPDPPTDLRATAPSHSSVHLIWNDNSSNESSFSIERRRGAADPFLAITQIAADTTSYSDTGLFANTTYGYRVKSLNSAGESSYSNEAVVRTPPAPEPIASATYLGRRDDLQGSWPEAFGARGAAIAALDPGLSPAASLQITDSVHIWENNTQDARALFRTSQDSGRIASAWFAPEQLEIRLSTEESQQITFYFLDWDRSGRSLTVSIRDSATDVPLDQRSVEQFVEGVYLSYELTGDVVLRVSRSSGVNAVLSGIFAGGPVNVPDAALRLRLNRTTSGMMLQAIGQPGAHFELESSSDLLDWSSTGLYELSGSELTVPVPTENGSLYFRGRVIP